MNDKLMKFDDYIKMQQQGDAKPKRHLSDEEHRIQCACVRWFAYQYPHLTGRLFAVPNGGGRSKVDAARLKAEGVVAGVSDLILLKPNRRHHALCIEMKKPGSASRQSDRQKAWEVNVTQDDEYRYIVCRSLDDFMREVNQYLTDI